MDKVTEQKTLTVEDMINNALHSDSNGVPIDWKQMTLLVYRLCSTRIHELQGVVDAYQTEQEAQKESGVVSEGTG